MWDKLSMNEKAAFIRTAVKNGVYNLDDIRNRYNEFAENAAIEKTVDNVNKSKADFVNRLKDADRQYIKDWEHPGYIATHKLSVGTDNKGNNYIYPEVQNIDGKLVDFTRPPYLPYAGMISAEERGDTVRVPSIEQGVRFTENYKKYYPKGKTFAKGGHIYDGETEDSQQMESVSPAMQFVQNYVDSDAYRRRFEAAGVKGSNTEASNRLGKTIIENIQDTENPIDASSHSKEYRESEGTVHRVEVDTNARWMDYNNNLAHELGHVVDTTSGGYEPDSYRDLYDRQRRGVTYNYVDKEGNIIPQSAENRHDRSSSEKYADLMQVRYDLFNRGIYDSTKDEPFTQKHLDAYIDALNKEGIIKQNRFLQMFNSDDIIDMMNTIAYNPNESYEGNNMAAFGGRLKNVFKRNKKKSQENPDSEKDVTTLQEVVITAPRKKQTQEKRVVVAKKKSPDYGGIVYSPIYRQPTRREIKLATPQITTSALPSLPQKEDLINSFISSELGKPGYIQSAKDSLLAFPNTTFMPSEVDSDVIIEKAFNSTTPRYISPFNPYSSTYNFMLKNGGYLFQKGGNLKGGKRAGDKVNTTQCATWSNGLLRDNGYLISGNAWGLNHADMLFNGFDGLEKPEVYNRAEVENYNHNAAGNVYTNFKSGTLNKNKPYVVNMYYNGSPAQEEAYKNGKGVTGTHTGILTHDGKEWKVTHNIHGTIHEEPFFSLQRGDNNYGVTAIYEPREDNLVNRIKGFLGFKYGGYLTM